MNKARDKLACLLNGRRPGAAPEEDIGGIVAAGIYAIAVNLIRGRSRLPQQPATAQSSAYRMWSALNIDAVVVVGQVAPPNPGTVPTIFAYQLLVDTGGAPGTVLAQNSYKVNKQWLRYAGHTASDEVFETTGIRARSVLVSPMWYGRLMAVGIPRI